MLGADALTQLCPHLGMLEQAQAVIEAIRSTPPARRVRSTAGNVSVRYPSRKMGRTIQAESQWKSSPPPYSDLPGLLLEP